MLDQAVFNENFKRIFSEEAEEDQKGSEQFIERRKHEEFEEDKRNAELYDMTVKEYRESM